MKFDPRQLAVELGFRVGYEEHLSYDTPGGRFVASQWPHRMITAVVYHPVSGLKGSGESMVNEEKGDAFDRDLGQRIALGRALKDVGML